MAKDCNFETKAKYKEDFSRWDLAVASHLNGDFADAIDNYCSMRETSSRIYYNMAMAYMKLEDYKNALLCFTSAVGKDENLAIAFFQRGTLQLQRKNAREAILDLEKTRLLLRGNLHINYRPLGLLCHLNEFTILFNLALAYLQNGEVQKFRMMLTEATHNADSYQRNQISDTLKLFEENKVSAIQPVQLNTDAIFVPPKEITTNLGHRKSSKRSMVVFASDEKNNTPSYKCAERVTELRKTMIRSRDAQIKRDGSVKDKLIKKIKSTGDLNISSHVRKNLSARKQRHSTGSVGPDSDISYKTLNEIKQSKMTPQMNNDIIFESSDHCSADRNSSLENCEELTRESKFKLFHDFEIDHFDTDTENILVSNQLIKDNCPEATHFDKQLAGSRRRFKGKAKSIGDFKVTKGKNIKRETKSTGDLERAKMKTLLPLERKKKSRTSFKRLIKLKSDTSDQMQNDNTVMMEGCKDEGDLLTMMVPVDNSADEKKQTSETAPEVRKGDDNNNFKSNGKQGSRYSLGSVFGDRSTVVRYALAEACDILTAAVTPTIDPFKLKPPDFKERRHTSKQKDRKMQQSSKKKRAPDPPKSTVCTSLLAAGHIFTAFVDLNYNNEAEDPSTLIENSTNLTDDVHDKTCSTNTNRKHPGDKSETKTTALEESTCSAVFDTAFVFPSLSETDIIHDMNNNEKYYDIEDAFAKEPETPEYVNTKHFVEITNNSTNHTEMRTENHEISKRGELCDENEENVEHGKNTVTMRMKNMFKTKRAKQPPPSYPPPPLRLNSAKHRNSKQGKGDKFSLNGLVGNSLLTSGIMIGAIVPVHENGKTGNLLTAHVNELSNLMEAACGIEKENLDDHAYVNVSKHLKYESMNTNSTGATITKTDESLLLQQQQQAEVINETLPLSPNILREFVTSNEKIRQAFGEFIHKQRSNKSAENTGILLEEENTGNPKHDYVNVSEF
ncbi:uncharacterized protein LOC132716693 [Ruditapes philippinarum]|uniref:uncharacterized protein LOC132716693 n=1 Tax=Ruditapes philippinarum TaxID=129788 RepID=UPI00295B56A6|nr:uncharacterized protein LOC132716693 [Ruditapes philippinarum]